MAFIYNSVNAFSFCKNNFESSLPLPDKSLFSLIKKIKFKNDFLKTMLEKNNNKEAGHNNSLQYPVK